MFTSIHIYSILNVNDCVSFCEEHIVINIKIQRVYWSDIRGGLSSNSSLDWAEQSLTYVAQVVLHS